MVDPLGHCGLHAFEGDLNATAIALVKEAEQALNMVLFDAFSGENRYLGLAKWAVVSEFFPR